MTIKGIGEDLEDFVLEPVDELGSVKLLAEAIALEKIESKLKEN